MKITMIRHGQPMHVETKDGTPANPDLSPLGREQAEAVAEWLQTERFHRIYASPLKRAYQTAMPLSKQLGLEIESRDYLKEIDHSQDNYVPLETLKIIDYDRWYKMMQGDFGYEVSFQDFSKVVAAGMKELVSENRGKHIAIFCHAGVINAFASYIIGFEPKLFFAPEYTGISRFAIASSGEKSVLTLNEAIHLEHRRGNERFFASRGKTSEGAAVSGRH